MPCRASVWDMASAVMGHSFGRWKQPDSAGASACWRQKQALRALGEGEYKEKAITLVREERAYLKKEMEILGMTVWDGQADYLFFRTDGIRDLYDRLLPEGIMIRRCRITGDWMRPVTGWQSKIMKPMDG